MTEDERGQAVVDHVGSCRCPGAPHASGETVRFRPEPSIAMGTAAMSARRDVSSVDEFIGVLAPIYLRFGIESWTCQGPDGALPVTTENVAERFPWSDGGYELSEFADALYGSVIVRPLAERIRRSSSAGPTAPPTPPTPASGPTPPEASGPSSPASTGGKRSGAPAL